MTHERDLTVSAIVENRDDRPTFERHELIAMAACVAIGALFAVAAHFLPAVANWIVA